MHNQKHSTPRINLSAYNYTAICGVVVCDHGTVWHLQDAQCILDELWLSGTQNSADYLCSANDNVLLGMRR